MEWINATMMSLIGVGVVGVRELISNAFLQLLIVVDLPGAIGNLRFGTHLYGIARY